MRRTVLIVLLMMAAGATRVQAQSNLASGEMKGTVSDSSGARVPGATLTATDTATGLVRSSLSDERGEFRILLLPPGNYALKAELTGFATQGMDNVQVKVGETLSIDFRLQVGSSAQTVVVTDDVPVIQTERAQQSNTIDERYIRNLPINRRDYLSFTLLAPGVTDANMMADNADFRVKQTPQSGLSFYGSNGRGNSITVDGAEANDGGGGVRATLGQEAVQEFQINRSNYSAELGGASGGVINIISKSGTNNLRGKVFLFMRNEGMDAADPFALALVDNSLERVKPDSRRQQYGATLGFPIKKDRTFAFLSFEGLDRNESSVVSVLTNYGIFEPTSQQNAVIGALAANTSTTPVPCIPTVPSYASLPPAQCAQVLRGTLTSKTPTVRLFETNSGVFPFITDLRSFSARLDHRFTNAHQTFLRYSLTDSLDQNQNTRALVGFTRANNVGVFDSNVVAGWTWVGNPRLVNDTRLQWSYRDFDVTTNDPNGPEFNITGSGYFRRDIFLPSLSIERRYEMSEGLTYLTGRHRLKFGVDALIRRNVTDSYTFMGGRFNFGTLPGALVSPALGSVPITAIQAFDLGLPQVYQQGFGSPQVGATYPFFAFYGQDTWSILPNLTLNYGLRYEIDDRRDPIPTDWNNLAPRFGLSWDPWKNSRTVFRGGFGIFYSPIYFQIDHVVNSLSEIDGYRQIAQVLTTLNAANPLATAGPINIYQKLRAQGVIGVPDSSRPIQASDLSQFGINISNTGPRPPLSVLFFIDPNYRSSYSEQASFGIEHQVGTGWSVSANYIFARTLKITRARDTNLLPVPVGPRGYRDWSTAGGCSGAAILNCFRDPLLFQNNLYESSARAFYNGLILEMERRFSSRFSLAGNYTFSKAMDEVTDFNSDYQAFDQINMGAERALSAFDQRHKFVMYAYLTTPSAGGAGSSFLKKVVADFVLTPIFRANSARPFNLLAGVDLNGDRHSTTDRPVGAGRNTGIGPGFWTLDLRLARQFRLGSETRTLELTAEGFNLFNHLNFASVNNTVGAAFQPPYHIEADRNASPSSPLGYTSAAEARRIQLGLRFSF